MPEATPDVVAARLARLRQICLGLPAACEKEAWGEPTFRAGEKGKMFATFADQHHDDRTAVWFKAADGAQEVLVGANPQRFFVPPYWGPSGGVGAWLDTADEPDWDELAMLLEDAYRLVAGKKLLTELQARR